MPQPITFIADLDPTSRALTSVDITIGVVLSDNTAPSGCIASPRDCAGSRATRRSRWPRRPKIVLDSLRRVFAAVYTSDDLGAAQRDARTLLDAGCTVSLRRAAEGTEQAVDGDVVIALASR